MTIGLQYACMPECAYLSVRGWLWFSVSPALFHYALL